MISLVKSLTINQRNFVAVVFYKKMRQKYLKYKIRDLFQQQFMPLRQCFSSDIRIQILVRVFQKQVSTSSSYLTGVARSLSAILCHLSFAQIDLRISGAISNALSLNASVVKWKNGRAPRIIQTIAYAMQHLVKDRYEKWLLHRLIRQKCIEVSLRIKISHLFIGTEIMSEKFECRRIMK